MLTGSQRGGDFLNNQLRGQWAERVALSMPIEGLDLVPFGPSGAAMPGEEDHREVIMTFREILLLESKRPDLLAFNRANWDGLGQAERERIAEWPKRRLEAADDLLVRQARCGIEVKNSTWHYETRRKAGGGPLSITVKKEEVADIQNWSSKTGLPVVFMQVLFDEVYCMSFGLDAIRVVINGRNCPEANSKPMSRPPAPVNNEQTVGRLPIPLRILRAFRPLFIAPPSPAGPKHHTVSARVKPRK